MSEEALETRRRMEERAEEHKKEKEEREDRLREERKEEKEEKKQQKLEERAYLVRQEQASNCQTPDFKFSL